MLLYLIEQAKKTGDVNLASLYPVGSVIVTTNSTNPATTLGFGTWVQIAQGTVLTGHT
jgi:hypothetical protein